MKLKTCYYCGTKYPENEPACPLCGQTEVEPEEAQQPIEKITPAPAPKIEERQEAPAQEREAEIPAKKSSGNVGNVIATVVCVILGVAVVAGILFILTSLNIISIGKKNVEGSNLTLPVETEAVAEPAPCSSVAVEPETVRFTVAGQKKLLNVKTEPADCKDTVTFESEDPQIAEVDEIGTVTAVSAGETTVNVFCGEFASSVSVSCEFQNENDPAEPEPEQTEETDPETVGANSLEISNPDFTLAFKGETTKLSVKGAAGAVTWSSSDTSVATVEDGKVTAVGPGQARITAKVGNASCTAIVRCNFPASSEPEPETVSADPSGRALSQEDVTLAMDEEFTLRLLENGNRVSGVSWSTSDGSVCSVDANGVVKKVGSGTAVVIGTYGGETFRCIVR